MIRLITEIFVFFEILIFGFRIKPIKVHPKYLIRYLLNDSEPSFLVQRVKPSINLHNKDPARLV